MKSLNLFLIAAIAYLLFFQGLGRSSLWDPDEPRQAIEAREMMERADYIHPYLNGEPYLESLRSTLAHYTDGQGLRQAR